VKEGYKGNVNGKKDAMGGNANRGNPNHSFAGKTNPSYMLCKDRMEMDSLDMLVLVMVMSIDGT
jgi:hypothetical protein